MNRLMTAWYPDAVAPGRQRQIPITASETLVYRYRVDGDANEAMLWIEGRDDSRNALEQAISASLPPASEIFTFDLARDVGVISAPPPRWLYIVHTDIPLDIVDDYNAWYDEEHLPRLVGVPGVERARRYVADGTLSPRYLTAYALSIKDAFESPEGLKARKTPWTERMRSLFQNTRRKMCELQS
ncbi:MAG: hypothetical protein JWN71_4456 [Xanthobacteraceae bacterium]|jgi:hypothetical protein|nr:hypothetical protein [Xanthobacteraceae bacterium]